MMINRIFRFLNKEIWTLQLDNYPRILAFLIRQLRIILMAVDGFKENRIQLRASALTFYTMMSVVPLAAMIFGISKGFGFQKRLEIELQNQFEGQDNIQEVVDYIIGFANSMLENINGGVIAGVGVVVLFWSVMQVLGNIEDSFNAIWQVHRSRAFVRKFSDYLSMMLIAPILFFLSSTVTVSLSSAIPANAAIFQYLGSILTFVAGLMPYLLIYVLFTLLYIIMPNTKVEFRNAVFAGIIAGTIFQITQWGYIYFQVGAARYGAIYSSFLALPLFLVWLRLSWLIVLLGAEISYAYQNIGKYEFESEALNVNLYNRRLITFLIVHKVVKRFQNGETPLTAKDIGNGLGIPNRLVSEIVFELTESGLFAEAVTQSPKERVLLPAVDIGKISISYVIDRLDTVGESSLIAEETTELKAFSGIQKDLLKAMEKSPANKLIMNV